MLKWSVPSCVAMFACNILHWFTTRTYRTKQIRFHYRRNCHLNISRADMIYLRPDRLHPPPDKLLIHHLQEVFFNVSQTNIYGVWKSIAFAPRRHHHHRSRRFFLPPRIQMLHSTFIIWRMGRFMLRWGKAILWIVAIHRPELDWKARRQTANVGISAPTLTPHNPVVSTYKGGMDADNNAIR